MVYNTFKKIEKAQMETVALPRSGKRAADGVSAVPWGKCEHHSGAAAPNGQLLSADESRCVNADAYVGMSSGYKQAKPCLDRRDRVFLFWEVCIVTEREMLELLLTKFDGFEQRMDRFEGDLSSLKKDVSSLKEDVSSLKEDVSSLKEDVDSLKKGFVSLSNRVDSLEVQTKELQELQRITTSELEGTVRKSIQVLYESHRMNAERFDRNDIDSIRRNSEIAAVLAKSAYEAVEKKLKAS